MHLIILRMSRVFVRWKEGGGGGGGRGEVSGILNSVNIYIYIALNYLNTGSVFAKPNGCQGSIASLFPVLTNENNNNNSKKI